MTIRRIKIAFVGPDGERRGEVTGSMDRRSELVREARGQLEKFKTQARRDGDPLGDADYEMTIEDAPATDSWHPRGS